jgi:DNA-binding transcriptional MerR regulator
MHGEDRVTKTSSKTKGRTRRSQTFSIAQAAKELGVSAEWIRAQVNAGLVTPTRASGKRSGRQTLTDADIATLRAASAEDPAAGGVAALTVVSRLETERANLLAQVAWERAIAQEQQKALENERARTEQLAAQLDLQRSRVEALKALTVLDRIFGRHKAV